MEAAAPEGPLWPSSWRVAIIAVFWGISTLIRFALSRSREFLADAGSAELTKNPDALVRALRKIDATPASTCPREWRRSSSRPRSERVSGLFSTHPSIAERIEAL